MLSVNFYDSGKVEEEKIKYVVIVAYLDDKLIIVRHKDRTTWEIPGGHREKHESSEDAARRELYEETGSKEFDLSWVCTYSVDTGKDCSFGQLYYANIRKLGKLPKSEIAEVQMVSDLPENLTYPLIQPLLSRKIADYLKRNKNCG